MAASVPQLPKIITFTLGGTSFKEDVLSAGVVPAPGQVLSVTTLDGVVHQDVAKETWALELEAIIDWDTTRPGLAYYLQNNAGDEVAFVLNVHDAAISTSKPAITGTCRLVPMQYGGTGNAYATATVSLPISGDPTVDTTP
jgi:hypothetical protein